MYMALHYYMFIFVDVIDDVSGGVGDLFKAAGDLTGVIQGGGKGKFFNHPQLELLLAFMRILCLQQVLILQSSHFTILCLFRSAIFTRPKFLAPSRINIAGFFAGYSPVLGSNFCLAIYILNCIRFLWYTKILSTKLWHKLHNCNPTLDSDLYHLHFRPSCSHCWSWRLCWWSLQRCWEILPPGINNML